MIKTGSIYVKLINDDIYITKNNDKKNAIIAIVSNLELSIS